MGERKRGIERGWRKQNGSESWRVSFVCIRGSAFFYHSLFICIGITSRIWFGLLRVMTPARSVLFLHVLSFLFCLFSFAFFLYFFLYILFFLTLLYSSRMHVSYPDVPFDSSSVG
jgi:hypothetical protein